MQRELDQVHAEIESLQGNPAAEDEVATANLLFNKRKEMCWFLKGVQTYDNPLTAELAAVNTAGTIAEIEQICASEVQKDRKDMLARRKHEKVEAKRQQAEEEAREKLRLAARPAGGGTGLSATKKGALIGLAVAGPTGAAYGAMIGYSIAQNKKNQQ